MSLTKRLGYVHCATPSAANDHCDFSAIRTTIHHLIYLLSYPAPQKYRFPHDSSGVILFHFVYGCYFSY
ncbi:hypothetical protein DEN86_05070 [Escherichia coli]|nr:hypothetical protein AW065_11515 [Escherichia coli]OTC19903.1 hypothetical protein AW073_23425 [Escherichia coli]OTE57207.1 hypothetical protein AW118_21915 [Escherichia coli]PDV42727.1 hypothetical protein BER14_23400 [Escherichia coli]TFY48992.1 hypothetical protein DEN86_05070 [Escherichia coli]